MTGPAALPLSDLYETVLAEERAHEIRRRLSEIEERLWYGRAGERACLAREIERARDEGERRRRAAGGPAPDLLILILGYSAEPLLLAVAHHAPAGLVLLREQTLGADFVERFGELWDHYRDELGVPAFREVEKVPVRDDAAELYRAVERLVESRRASDAPRVVLDITGAKKTMVAGAFLAAGMLDLETTYVDFKGYDSVLRRPKPGASRVEAVVHPAALFRLRERQQLAEAFDARRYAEAALLAERLEETVRRPEVEQVLGRAAAESRAAAYRWLCDLARAYDDWRQGFYRDAAGGLRDLGGVPVPPQVELLGATWPGRSAGHDDIVRGLAEEEIGGDPSTGLAYFLDVLTWVDGAAVASRPRDACLRLFGTIEAVASWALEILVVQDVGALEIEGVPAADLVACLDVLDAAPNAPASGGLKRLRGAVVEVLRGDPNGASKILGTPGGRELDGARLLAGLGLTPDARTPPAPLPLRAYLQRPPLAGEPYRALQKRHRFSRLRNKAVHWLAPVPADAAAQVLDVYRQVLLSVVPIVVARVRDRAGAEPAGSESRGTAGRTAEWAEALLAAAAGSIPPAHLPLTFDQARRAARAAAGADTASEA